MTRIFSGRTPPQLTSSWRTPIEFTRMRRLLFDMNRSVSR